MKKANIYMGSSVIAEQVGASSPFRLQEHRSPHQQRYDDQRLGAMPSNDGGRLELEPLGSVIPTQQSELQEPHIYAKGGAISSPDYGCVDELTDAPAPCSVVEADSVYTAAM